MHKAKIHPFILLSLFINAIAMGIFAFENYAANNTGSIVIFIILCLFLIVLTVCGLVRNSKIKHISK